MKKLGDTKSAGWIFLAVITVVAFLVSLAGGIGMAFTVSLGTAVSMIIASFLVRWNARNLGLEKGGLNRAMVLIGAQMLVGGLIAGAATFLAGIFFMAIPLVVIIMFLGFAGAFLVWFVFVRMFYATPGWQKALLLLGGTAVSGYVIYSVLVFFVLLIASFLPSGSGIFGYLLPFRDDAIMQGLVPAPENLDTQISSLDLGRVEEAI